MTLVENLDPTTQEAAERLIGSEFVSSTRIFRGGNNQIYRADTADGGRYAIKIYFSDKDDQRDRLGTEYSALTLLRNHSVNIVPRPIGMDRAESLAVYEFIEGEPISPETVSGEDIKSIVSLLGALNQLSLSEEIRNRELAEASDSCFSVAAIVAQIDARLERLERSVTGHDGSLEALDFLRHKYRPVLSRAGERARGLLTIDKVGFDGDIPIHQRTLSPSDYGFHNALRRQDGELVFLDFEYFGWDDPAKAVSDFLLHPAMNLSAGHKRQFLKSAIAGLDSASGHLVARIRAVYPLWALKWCLILLNEFVPEFQRRRQFAGASGGLQQIRVRQLEAAHRLLAHAELCMEIDQIEDWIT